MTDPKLARGARARRVFQTLGLIAVGFAMGLAMTCVLSPVIGPTIVHYNNAHSKGKISQGDAWLTGAELMAAGATLSGLALAIIFRKRRELRELSLGLFSFGVAGIIAFILLLLMIAAILRD